MLSKIVLYWRNHKAITQTTAAENFVDRVET